MYPVHVSRVRHLYLVTRSVSEGIVAECSLAYASGYNETPKRRYPSNVLYYQVPAGRANFRRKTL